MTSSFMPAVRHTHLEARLTVPPPRTTGNESVASFLTLFIVAHRQSGIGCCQLQIALCFMTCVEKSVKYGKK